MGQDPLVGPPALNDLQSKPLLRQAQCTLLRQLYDSFPRCEGVVLRSGRSNQACQR